MKKIIGLALVLTALVLFAPNEGKAQVRIQFAKGKSSATVRGKTGTYGEIYVLRSRGGQKLTINLSPGSGVRFNVQNSRGDDVLLRAERGGYYEVYIEDGGDLTLYVLTKTGRSVPFTLTVGLTRISDI